MTEPREASVVGKLYLAPVARIMLLWFIAVVRDHLGEREGRGAVP